MSISSALGGVQDSLNDALDILLGTRKAVCPICGKVERLVKETNVIAPHFIVPDDPDFSNGIDFDVIKKCAGSGRVVRII